MKRLRNLATDINKASHDQRTKDLIEKTWLLQDRLNFGDQPQSLVIMRQLGHVDLCGVLHVAYQTRKEVKGQYMLCALFRSCLLLATTEKSSPGYNVVACIPTKTVQLEEADNGRGRSAATMQRDILIKTIRSAMSHSTLFLESCFWPGSSTIRDSVQCLFTSRRASLEGEPISDF